jgi:hypothetical protein
MILQDADGIKRLGAERAKSKKRKRGMGFRFLNVMVQ